MKDSVLREIESASMAIAALARQADTIAAIAELLTGVLESGGTVIFAGNGGSAADAQHLAAELSGRYLMERKALSALAVTTNTSALTAIGNDYGFDEVFARQIAAAARPGDAVVLISTSGTSPNIRRAVEVAREKSCRVVAFTGPKGRGLAAAADAALVVDAEVTPHIQEAHIVAGHVICGLIEAALAG